MTSNRKKQQTTLGHVIFTAIFLAISSAFFLSALNLSRRIRLAPLVCTSIVTASLLLVLIMHIRELPKGAIKEFKDGVNKNEVIAVAWLLGLLGSAMSVGLPITAVIFPIAYMQYRKATWKSTIIMVLVLCVVTYVLFIRVLGLMLNNGALGYMLGIPYFY